MNIKTLSLWVKKHPDWTATLILLGVAVVVMFRYLVQPNVVMWPRSELGTDLLNLRWPSAYFFRDSIQTYGQIPLWQETTMSGLPMIGNPALRVYYPPQLLLTILPIPILWMFTLMNTIHLWIAGVGTYGLARYSLGVSRFAAFIAGLALMLTPRLSSNMAGDLSHTHGLCMVPLCLWLIRLTLHQRSWRWAIAAGFGLSLLYLLNLQFILYTGWFIGVYFIYQSIWLFKDQGRSGLSRWIQQAGLLALVLVVCIGLSAFQLFSFVTYLPYQIREAMTLEDSNRLALPIPFLIHAIAPIPYKFPEWELYVGLLPLLFAPLSILDNTKRRETYFWIGVFIFAVLFSLGSATPIYNLMFHVPGFRFVRVAPRMWYFVAIATAMLTALAVNYFLEQGKSRRLSSSWRRWLWIGGGALILITIAGRYIIRRSGEVDWLLGFAAATGLIIGVNAIQRWTQGRLKSAVQFVGLISIAIIIDLLPLDVAFTTPKSFEEVFAVPEIAQSLTQEEGLFRIYGVRREIPDHILVANGLEAVDGLNSFQFASYSKLMRIASGCDLEGIAAAVPPCAADEISQTAYLDAKPNPALLGLLNTKYIIAPFELPADERLILREEIGDERLYENTAVLPRAFAVGRIELVADEASMWSQLQAVDLTTTAVIDPQPGINFAGTESNFYQSAEIAQYQPNEILIHVNMPDNGLLILGDTWTPGWQATIDGAPSPVLRVDGALRGVYILAGEHQVRFYFLPPALMIGLGITLVTLTLAIISLGVGFFRLRQPS